MHILPNFSAEHFLCSDKTSFQRYGVFLNNTPHNHNTTLRQAMVRFTLHSIAMQKKNIQIFRLSVILPSSTALFTIKNVSH